MKNRTFALATTLAATVLLAAPAHAQSSDRGDRDDRRSEYRQDRVQQDRGQRDDTDSDMRRGRGDERGWRGDDDRADRNRGYRGPQRGMGYPGPRFGMGPIGPMGPMAGGGMSGFGGPMQRGARFRIVSGDARIDIECPVNVEIQSCVQAAGQLLDRVSPRSGQARPSGSSGSGGSLDTPTDSAPDRAAPSRM